MNSGGTMGAVSGRRGKIKGDVMGQKGQQLLQEAHHTILEFAHDNFEILRGNPAPLGSTQTPQGLNFAIFSKHATAVNLVLFPPEGGDSIAEFPLDPKLNRTGHVWHCLIQGLDSGVGYGFRLDRTPNFHPHLHRFNPSTIVFDPESRALSGGEIWGEPAKGVRLSSVVDATFDWEFDQPIARPLASSIIYEAHVRSFTKHPSSGVKHPGTFRGIIEKIPYLKELGITAIELMPVNEFDECELDRANPLTGERLFNLWGYNSLSFYALKASYASNPAFGAPLLEFKEMVRELHKAGIEVILDIVFNHTGEGDHRGPSLCFKGIDNSVYYIIDKETGAYHNYSGCGNTLNCNHPVVRQMIIDCLRYWVTEMHVDGFRFDLASILGRGQKGEVLANPPLLEVIAHDPVLADTKIIAEAWDAAGLYQVGSFPAWGRWAEWNGKFRDDVRRWIKGDEGMVSAFASRLLGSPDLYHGSGRAPYHSINFITSHDGFTLHDLVSYNHKHNLENGENNNDGTNDNHSWNCGVEGETSDPKIRALRVRQMKNFMAVLFFSQGVPMLLAGDPFARTQKGNNNAYCQDNNLSWIDWALKQKNADLFRFTKGMIQLRNQNSIFRQECFGCLNTLWHGVRIGQPDWSPQSHCIGLHLSDSTGRVQGFRDVYFFSNAHWQPHDIEIPQLAGRRWLRIVDTGLSSPNDFAEAGNEVYLKNPKLYSLGPRSTLILAAR
jgi:glycogen operon protein